MIKKGVREPGTAADIRTSIESVQDNSAESSGDQIQDQLTKIQATPQEDKTTPTEPDQQVAAFAYRRRRIHGKKRRKNC